MNKEQQREKLNEMWEAIDFNSFNKTNFKADAPKLLEFLITSVLLENNIHIGVTFDNEKAITSNITYDIYNNDKELTLKLYPKSIFKLEISFYDWDGEKQAHTHKLSKDEIKTIPEGLIISMQEALKKEDTISINTTHLKG